MLFTTLQIVGVLIQVSTHPHPATERIDFFLSYGHGFGHIVELDLRHVAAFARQTPGGFRLPGMACHQRHDTPFLVVRKKNERKQPINGYTPPRGLTAAAPP